MAGRLRRHPALSGCERGGVLLTADRREDLVAKAREHMQAK
ncbi:MAG: hypothetical protein PHU25_12040 [Deltaproteobacteria bacterium]|nr:hypothetical protein [Deltaproteobacteria bacterium]